MTHVTPRSHPPTVSPDRWVGDIPPHPPPSRRQGGWVRPRTVELIYDVSFFFCRRITSSTFIHSRTISENVVVQGIICWKFEQLWKKSIFWSKNAFLPVYPLQQKKQFLTKNSDFLKNDEGGCEIVLGSKNHAKAGPNQIGIICWKFEELWKNRFFYIFWWIKITARARVVKSIKDRTM